MSLKRLYFINLFTSGISLLKRHLGILFLPCLLYMLWTVPAYGKAADIWDGSVDTGWYKGSSANITSYTIKSAAELAGLASLVNNGEKMREVHFYLDNDLYLNNPTTYTVDENGKLQVQGRVYSWTPIGKKGSSFQGYFHGNGHEIAGLYIHNSTTKLDSAGLFGYVSSAEICDLALKNVWLYEESEVGGFVGNASRVTMKNCTISNSVLEGTEKWIGGLTGWVSQDSYFENCINSALVKGKTEIGGISGKASLTVYNNCHNYGKITANSENDALRIGGILGYGYQNTFKNCSNQNTITGVVETGGLAGNVEISSGIQNCFNTGTIIGQGKTGGLVGCFYNKSSVTDSYNIGNISGSQMTGGLFGATDNSVVMQYCYSCGEIQRAVSDAGALIGNIKMDSDIPVIENCYYEEMGISGAGNTVHDIGTGKGKESFTGGEIAYLLDMEEGEHRGIWSMKTEGACHPVLKTADMQVIHRICFLYNDVDKEHSTTKNFFYKYTDEHGALKEVPAVPYKEGFTGIWSENHFEKIQEDKTVVAVYMPVYLNVLFQREGMADVVRKVPYGSALLLFPDIPEKLGYLGEWNVSQEVFLYITKDITAKVVYRPVRYRIVFDGNGNSGGTMREMECIYNTESNLLKNQYWKENALFLGWNTEKNGTGEYFTDGAVVKNLSAKEGDRIYLYAVWKDTTYLQNKLKETLSVSTSKVIFTKSSAADTDKKTAFWRQKKAGIKKITRVYKVAGGNNSSKENQSKTIHKEKGKKKKSKELDEKKETWKLSLKKVKGANGYQLSYRYGKKGKIKKQKSKAAVCLLEKQKEKNLYVRVRAYKKINGKKVYTVFSKWIRIAEDASL